VSDLPRAVHLVSQAPVFYFVRLCEAMFAPQFAPARALFHIAIFHQRGGFLRRTGTKIEPHERKSAHGLAPGHEFIGAEPVAVEGIPRLVEHARTVLLRAYAVQPVVAGDEISARIANDGNT